MLNLNSYMQSLPLSLSGSISYCDAAAPWQLGSQDAATPTMQGIIDLHHDIFFFLILIFVFILLLMETPSLSSSSVSASSSSNSNNNRKDKRKEKENFLRNLVLTEVNDYLEKYKSNIIEEFPQAHPYIETPLFLNQVSTELLRGDGLLPTNAEHKMNLLHSVHKNLQQSFTLVKEEGYTNNVIYYCIRSILIKFK